MAKKYDQLKREQIKQKFEEKKLNFKWKFNRFTKWIVNNKEFVIIALPVVISGTKFVIRHLGTHRNLVKQEEIKNLYCYDRSLGHYWKLRRELTNDEWVYIDKRKKAGERLADILDELKVLK